ncbi:DUF4199 domain-containing protein [Chryseolinea soli]|uniref:DUF4199 domain-containing protein n=1 Tax=Chryseolinea soli TaxID=2321403 RepID=A0A385SIN1_9BACT|nr:DUF4199 domain-containing protein [Chryseolinea soli]AYB29775.1 DUF4199 domain-containing protein [Chryseolinea soli]
MTSRLLRISARWGAVAGVLAFIMLVMMYYMGRHPLMISPFLDFRILLFGVFVYFSLKEFRDYDQGGVLYFWQASLGGTTVVVIMTLVTSALLLIFGSWEKGFVPGYVTEMTAYLKGFPKEEIDRIGKKIYESNLNTLPTTNIWQLTQTYILQGLIIGFFVNIIVSVILRRQPKNQSI